MIGLLTVVAYALIATALHISNGFYHPVSLVCVIAAFALALVGTVARFPERLDDLGRKYTPWALAAVVAAEVVFTFLTGFGFLNNNNLLLALGFIFFGMLPGLYLTKVESKFDWRLPLILVVFSGLFAVTIPRYSRNDQRRAPRTDVWVCQQYACHHLMNGKNPYSESFPNYYSDEFAKKFYGKENIKDNRVLSHPYPPLSVLLGVPGFLVGDVRWTMWACILGTIICLVATGRRLGLPAGHPAELAAVAILYHPRMFFLLYESWIEPMLALALAFSALCIASNYRLLKPVAVACVIATKQYGLLFLPSFLITRQLRWRDLVIGVALAVLTGLPFFLWDWQGFLHGNVWHHYYQPSREGSLSLLVFVNSTMDWKLPSAIGLLMAVIVVALSAWRRQMSLSYACVNSAAVVLAFFLFNKYAFFNYYWVICVALMLSVLTYLGESNGNEKSGSSGTNDHLKLA